MADLPLLLAQTTNVDNAWWWVAAAYSIVLGGIAVYVGSIVLRIRRTRRQLDNLA